jgi:hypothetical protein
VVKCYLWLGDMKASARRILMQREAPIAGIFVGIFLAFMVRLAFIVIV